MPTSLHPTAIVDAQAQLADDVEIGPYCLVGAEVTLDAGVRLLSHVVVQGRTRIGAGTVIYPFASIGHQPQDLKFGGEPSELIIGAHNTIREHVTMNPGTRGGGMVTRVGDHGLFMVGCHVAHDCLLGDRLILANNATLAGHVVIGDHAILGGLSAVHQFVRIGDHAMIGGMSGVEHDVIPFGLVMGDRARLSGLNLVGLERRGFGRDDIRTLQGAYRQVFGGDGTLAERVEAVATAHGDHPLVGQMVAFVREKSARGLCQPAPTARTAHAG